MDERQRPNPITDSLLDLLRGELDPASAAALSARVDADPTLRAERDRLATLLRRTAAAHELPLDPQAAERVSARIRHRIQREEGVQRERGRPVHGQPTTTWGVRWARFLAIAVAAHVVVLGLLAIFVRESKPSAPEGNSEAVLRGPDVPWTPADDLLGQGFPGDDAPFGEAAFALAHPMPIEDLLRDLPGSSMREGVLAIGPVDADFAAGPALPAFARAGQVRSDADAKYAILARVGEKTDLVQVAQSLRSLAGRQSDDGSFFLSPTAQSSLAAAQREALAAARRGATVRVTATVLLAFLGDGHTSRAGTHRDVVAKGIAWLRSHVGEATSLEDRAIALFALTEDYAFTSGEWTPTEARGRADELRGLVAATSADPRARESSPWVALALDAGARAGLSPPASDRRWAVAYAALPFGEAGDPRTSVLEGTALLLARKADVFQAWNKRASAALKARLRGGDVDVEEIALIVLALEVPYRTY